MKLSNGSIAEFILGIFFIIVGFNCTDLLAMLICICGGALASGHCIYCWIKKRKENQSNDKK